MVVLLVIIQLATWTFILAAPNNASGIARATGRTGAHAKVLTGQIVVMAAHRAVSGLPL
jgi:hypothetical protein